MHVKDCSFWNGQRHLVILIERSALKGGNNFTIDSFRIYTSVHPESSNREEENVSSLQPWLYAVSYVKSLPIMGNANAHQARLQIYLYDFFTQLGVCIPHGKFSVVIFRNA
jgi:hypothetical protein